MNSQPIAQNLHTLLRRNVRTRKNSDPPQTFPQKLPETAVLAEVIKTLETSLQQKGLLNPPRSEHGFTPLWFLVETERNVFLWRNGLSLIHQDEFEFWVDLEALVNKRITQLNRSETENPFVNPSWDINENLSTIEPALREDEVNYLESFLNALETILPHVHALSQVGSELQREIANAQRETVLLPAKKAR